MMLFFVLTGLVQFGLPDVLTCTVLYFVQDKI